MKAAVYHGKDDLRLEEIPIPEPGAGEMLVRSADGLKTAILTWGQ
jgi:NADPH:quinone reductase-like Zn-dependent oxidoreductase